MRKYTSKPSMQDFSTVNSHLDKIKKELELDDRREAWYFLVMRLVLEIQDDEIEDSITDSIYRSKKKDAGHDRGIDAIHIDETDDEPVVHLFSFEFTNKFEKLTNHYPGKEIDKIIRFIEALDEHDKDHFATANETLQETIKYIWNLFSKHIPKFVMHVCSNTYNGFETKEEKRLTTKLSEHGIVFEYHLLTDVINLITHKGRITVNASVQATGKSFFGEDAGDIRALIVNLPAHSVVRMVINDDTVRNAPDFNDIGKLATLEILEDAFSDNVRVYLQQRSRINRNIKESALSSDGDKFFYYNNGITIICKKLIYTHRTNSVIQIKDLQVVNGSQTIHALYDVLKEDPDKILEINILCRIYETDNQDIARSIAEFTNSQNPVNNRDIRSNDYVLVKLENELIAHDYFFERKKNQHATATKAKRIDAERAGQALLSFIHEKPATAKDKKRKIFTELFEKIFHNDITATEVLLSSHLLSMIDQKKRKTYHALSKDPSRYEADSFILHASLFILYGLRLHANVHNVPIIFDNAKKILAFYERTTTDLREVVKAERKKQGDKYTHRMFFKSDAPATGLRKVILKHKLPKRASRHPR